MIDKKSIFNKIGLTSIVMSTCFTLYSPISLADTKINDIV